MSSSDTLYVSSHLTPMRYRHGKNLDDADIAAGSGDVATQQQQQSSTLSVPNGILRHRSSAGASNESQQQQHNNNEFEEFAEKFSREVEKKMMGGSFDDTNNIVDSERLIVLGIDISHLSRRWRFIICAGGVYMFSLMYGFLQELLSVQILNRKLGLFLALAQFIGYTGWSYVFRTFDEHKKKKELLQQRLTPTTNNPYFSNLSIHNNKDGFYSKPGVVAASLTPSSSFLSLTDLNPSRDTNTTSSSTTATTSTSTNGVIPMHMYFGLSILRAIDLGMTNLSMQYMNYPAKTMMKSSRVVFTMLFGVVISRRRYPIHDYIVVLLMVTGLALFLHADSTSSAVFQSMGVAMLAISLMCDGAITNMSESLMKKHNVGQDEYIFRLYSIATLAIGIAAMYKGDMVEGTRFMLRPGTYEETILHDAGGVSITSTTWTVWKKIIVLMLFSTTGFLGSSCSACITREYGALTMSITSTARKATTLFLSFVCFKNVCTWEHVLGIVIFISSLIFKSLRKGRKGVVIPKRWHNAKNSAPASANYELGSFV